MTQLQATQQPSAKSPLRGLAAGLAALTAFGNTAYQVLTPGPPTASFGSLGDWLRDMLFLAYLLSSILAVVACVRIGWAPRAAAWLVGVGYGAIAVGVTLGLVLQEDPDWFMVLGGPGNLLGAAGFVTWAIVGRRRRRLPLWASLLCGVGGVVAVLFAELGTSVLIGSFWIYAAGVLGRDNTDVS